MAFPPRESQPEKQKVASPMFTRIESFLVENRFAGASCAHERIHHRDATPCKQVSPFALVVNVLDTSHTNVYASLSTLLLLGTSGQEAAREETRECPN